MYVEIVGVRHGAFNFQGDRPMHDESIESRPSLQKTRAKTWDGVNTLFSRELKWSDCVEPM